MPALSRPQTMLIPAVQWRWPRHNLVSLRVCRAISVAGAQHEAAYTKNLLLLFDSYRYSDYSYTLTPNINDISVPCSSSPPRIHNSSLANTPLLRFLAAASTTFSMICTSSPHRSSKSFISSVCRWSILYAAILIIGCTTSRMQAMPLNHASSASGCFLEG